jgi:hypothetical protein
MKHLDRFSRFEKNIYLFFAVFVIWAAPLLAIFLVDAFFLKELSPFIRYPLWAGLYIVGILVGVAIGSYVEDFFDSVRKIFRMKPLKDIEAEISEEREKAELAMEERKERWFTECSESKQRYSFYLLQQQQLSRLNDIHRGIEIIKFLLIGFLVYMLFHKFFG